MDAIRFKAIDQALKIAGIAWPVIVLDLPAVMRNLDRLKSVAAPRPVRIVVKSLPCARLLELVSQTLETDRFMTFNLPMLAHMSAQFPHAKQMLGKPLPIEAAVKYLDDAPSASNIDWLIDNLDRLQAYEAHERARGIVMNIVLEIDIGLHRGGFEVDKDLRSALSVLANAKSLKLTGLMGYEAHLAALPSMFGWRERHRQKALSKLAMAKGQVAAMFGDEAAERLIINSAGSKTLGLHDSKSVANEMSAGSILVKPTDFDHDLTSAFEPAAYIATPVLKGPMPTRVPGMEIFDRWNNLLFKNASRSIFIHGGHWMAEPVFPKGLDHNRLVGYSSNQEMLTCPPDTSLKNGDFVFFRPHQSEAILLQFGDIAVFDGEKIADHWPVFAASA